MVSRRIWFLIIFITILSFGGYLWISHVTHRLGFPLDDAWIHQTYARNLADRSEWSYLPGEPSGGSTAPLWSVILSVGYLIGFGPYLWTYLISWLFLIGLAVLGFYSITHFSNTGKKEWKLWAAGIMILEWHLVWATGSGMETLPFGFLVTLVLVWLVLGWRRSVWLGALVGLGTWLRPDSLTLLGPIGFTIVFEHFISDYNLKKRLLSLFRVGFGFALVFLPYLYFNQVLTGDVWPNTFYAKQAEYAALRDLFIGKRMISQLSLPLTGVGVLLFPGVIMFFIRSWRERQWSNLSGLIWYVGYAALYAWRLPVTYQHGRYLIPAMPIFFLWGVAGMAEWYQPIENKVWKRVVLRTWQFSSALVLIIFWGLGARAYALDVAVIESEMVATAKWVQKNTGREALIAAHDIGALGYFSQRQILDLAGLISPEVIPFIRNTKELKNYLDTNNADYLVTLKNWYPGLEANLTVVFDSEGEFSPSLGGTNMVVYKWGTSRAFIEPP